MASLLTGAVTDGVYTKTEASKSATNTSSTSTSLTSASTGSAYDQEMFLKLLTAEMQYQDPLEPTDNAEYVSQLASFTTIDAIQQVQSSMQTIRANSLVGNYVMVTDSDGEQVSGKVDFVTTDSDGNMVVGIGDETYLVDNVLSVIDSDYYEGSVTAGTFTEMVTSLPAYSDLTLSDAEDVANVIAVYNALDTNSKQYISESTLATLTSLQQRISELTAAASSSAESTE